MTAAGGDETMITPPGKWQVVTDWSSDGRSLLMNELGEKSRWDLVMSAPQANAQPVSWLKSRFSERFGRFSPDGKWIAYSSDAAGKSEIFISPVADPSQRTMISKGEGQRLVWGRDGREIFYLTPEQELFSVP